MKTLQRVTLVLLAIIFPFGSPWRPEEPFTYPILKAWYLALLAFSLGAWIAERFGDHPKLATLPEWQSAALMFSFLTLITICGLLGHYLSQP